MKAIFSITFLSLLSLTSLISGTFAAPNQKANHANTNAAAAKKHPPQPAVGASGATFISSAPHFSVYSDRFVGVNPLPDPSQLAVSIPALMFFSIAECVVLLGL
jgi:hypothetical protein